MNHEKLECYQKLMLVAEEVAKRVTKWPRGYSYLADQIKRTMISAVLNVCEGMGSIAEVSAGLDLARTFGIMKANDTESLKSLLKLAYVKISALP